MNIFNGEAKNLIFSSIRPLSASPSAQGSYKEVSARRDKLQLAPDPPLCQKLEKSQKLSNSEKANNSTFYQKNHDPEQAEGSVDINSAAEGLGGFERDLKMKKIYHFTEEARMS